MVPRAAVLATGEIAGEIATASTSSGRNNGHGVACKPCASGAAHLDCSTSSVTLMLYATTMAASGLVDGNINYTTEVQLD